MSWLWHSPRERPIRRAALLGDEVLVPYVSMVGLGDSRAKERRERHKPGYGCARLGTGEGAMIRKFEGGARHIRASGLHILLYSVLLAGTAPLAAHGQSFEHATKDKVMAALPALGTLAQRSSTRTRCRAC